MRLTETDIPDCYLVEPHRHEDARGEFVKHFRRSALAAHGIDFPVAETYVSVSVAGSIRGMHFQAPPHDHWKLVHCVSGAILDCVVDVRAAAVGTFLTAELTDGNRLGLLVPPGTAHGFLTLSQSATVSYAVSTEHAPAHDLGIRWDSFGFAWPVADPVVSARDEALPALADLATPFR